MKSQPRAAVIVRSHIANLKTAHLLAQLSEGQSYDLYVSANETNGRLSFGGYTVLGHTLRSFEQLGFSMNSPRAILTYSDVLFSIIQAAIPSYDIYILVEFDIHFLTPAAAFMDELIDRVTQDEGRPIDLAATHCGKAWQGWAWYEECSRLYPNVYQSFFPIVCLSARAIRYLLQSRYREAEHGSSSDQAVFCEAFMPSALMAAKTYRIEDIETLIPGAYDRGTFNIVMPDAFQQGRFESVPARMAHPVKELSEAVAAPGLRERVAAAERRQQSLPRGRAAEFAMSAGAMLNRAFSGDPQADAEFNRLLARVG